MLSSLTSYTKELKASKGKLSRKQADLLLHESCGFWVVQSLVKRIAAEIQRLRRAGLNAVFSAALQIPSTAVALEYK